MTASPVRARQAASARPSRSRLLAAVLAMTAAVSLVSCNDDKAANKDNFKKALAAFFGKNCAMLTAARMSMDLYGQPTIFPVNVRAAPEADPDAPRFTALMSAGLLQQGPDRTTLDMFRRTAVFKSYDLTDKGRSLWKPANAMGPGSPAGFCAGHLQVDAVDSFTEPSVQGTTTVSTVNAHIHGVYDDWTRAPAVQSVFQEELSHATPIPATFPMILMNDGWAVSIAPPANEP